MGALQVVTTSLRLLLQSRAVLVAENLALRQQIAILQRSVKRPRLHRRDRIFWVWVSCLWRGWRSSLLVVQPETVIRWHRQGFRLYWRWKSRSRGGRPKLDAQIRVLIRRMSRDNPTWGRRRIRSELHLLGYEVAQLTVAKYMVREGKSPSQGWRVFLANHAREIAATDFLSVPTVNFRILICFLVLRHYRRTVVHSNVTSQPTARWTAQQIVEAFPYDTAPRYLLRDRDRIYGSCFENRVRGMGIEGFLIAPRSPWQNPFVERLIGSIRRECLDHVLELGEANLLRVLREYFAYYHDSRPHQSLDGNALRPREIEPASRGRIVAEPWAGGLHHRYRRAASVPTSFQLMDLLAREALGRAGNSGGRDGSRRPPHRNRGFSSIGQPFASPRAWLRAEMDFLTATGSILLSRQGALYPTENVS
jgi:transposase InsO family protein